MWTQTTTSREKHILIMDNKNKDQPFNTLLIFYFGNDFDIFALFAENFSDFVNGCGVSDKGSEDHIDLKYIKHSIIQISFSHNRIDFRV